MFSLHTSFRDKVQTLDTTVVTNWRYSSLPVLYTRTTCFSTDNGRHPHRRFLVHTTLVQLAKTADDEQSRLTSQSSPARSYCSNTTRPPQHKPDDSTQTQTWTRNKTLCLYKLLQLHLGSTWELPVFLGRYFSADSAEDLSFIYVYPQPTPDDFDIMDYKTALSQQALLYFQQLDHHDISMQSGDLSNIVGLDFLNETSTWVTRTMLLF
jgi:hypothetical protein